MAKPNRSSSTADTPSPAILPAPIRTPSGTEVTNRVRAKDITTKFKLPEYEIHSRLMQACANNEITAWAGRALFTEGEISHLEANWQILPETWVSHKGLFLSFMDLGDDNPVFSLREGTLRGKGFSPVTICAAVGRLVDVSSVGFKLTRLEFDADDLAYYLGEPSEAIACGDALTSASALNASKLPKVQVGAQTDAKRWEQFAAAFAVLSEDGALDGKSETKVHEKVASYLSKRGHSDAFGVDNVRSLLRRVKAWKANHPYPDDDDFGKTRTFDD